MGDTTLTIDESVKDRLRSARTDAHDNWGDVIDELLTIAPDLEDFRDGCLNCGETPRDPNRMADSGGVIHFFSVEHNGSVIREANYFCSPECAHETKQEVNSQFPTHPDAVIVGGRSELRTTVEDARFQLDGEYMGVSMDVPGAFGGESSNGDEYDYIGEPVYIENDGEIVQEGVIDDIIHEEAHTALVLAHDHSVTRTNHPDEDVRQEYEEKKAKWTDEECDNCGEEVHFMVEEPPEECPNCESAAW